MADYPQITKISEIDVLTPAGTEVAGKLDDSIRQIKAFLATFLAQAHADEGGLKDEAVTDASIPDGAITTGKIANSAVTAAKIADAAVTAAKMAANAVITAAIQDGAITVAKLATDAVETVKIKDANVTSAKILDAAITSAKILSHASDDTQRAIVTNAIKDAQVTEAKLAATSVSSGKMKFSSGSDSSPVLMVGRTGGAAEATIGGILTASYSAGVLTFALGSATSSNTASGALYARLEERTAANTDNTTLSATTLTTRANFVEVVDASGIVSVSAGVITFAKVGLYLINLTAPCSNIAGYHRTSLFRVTSGPTYTLIASGTTAQCPANTTTESHLRMMLTTTSDNEQYVFRTYASVGGNMGDAGNLVADGGYNGEIYGICEIIKS